MDLVKLREELEIDEGVEYQIDLEEKTVIRVEDFTEVGTWDKETSSIVFFSWMLVS